MLGGVVPKGGFGEDRLASPGGSPLDMIPPMRIAILFLFGILAVAQTRPLIGVGGIIHETNTFNPKKTALADFETGIGGADGILRGKDIITVSAKANNTTAGFIYGAT